MVCGHEEHLEGLKANIALQQSLGINPPKADLVWTDEPKDLEPYLSTVGLVAAACEP